MMVHAHALQEDIIVDQFSASLASGGIRACFRGSPLMWMADSGVGNGALEP